MVEVNQIEFAAQCLFLGVGIQLSCTKVNGRFIAADKTVVQFANLILHERYERTDDYGNLPGVEWGNLIGQRLSCSGGPEHSHVSRRLTGAGIAEEGGDRIELPLAERGVAKVFLERRAE